MNIKKGIGLAALALIISAFSFFTFINQVQAVAISPVKFELAANPGDELRNVLRIYNDTAEPVNVSVLVDNFSPTGEDGQVVIDETSPDTGFSLRSWVSLSEPTFDLEPRTSKVVEFLVKVPLNAEPGGHYGSILASIAPINAVTGGGVGIAQRVGALLLLDVSGEVTEKMYVAELTAPRFSEYGPVDLSLRLKNDGSVHLKPRGFIRLTNMFGKDAGTIDIPQTNVLPQSIRKFELPWGVKYMYGKYTASLNAIYGSSNETLSAVTTFWIIPWKLVTIAVLIFLIVTIGIVRGRRRIALAFNVLRGKDIAS